MATDAELLEERFQALAADLARFSSEVAKIIVPGGTDGPRLADLNLEIARLIFGKWCMEIFVILYNLGPIGFEGLRGRLGEISPRVLSRKLRMLGDQGFVQRTVIMDSRPPGVRYSLTEKGATVAIIGTPVFLFLTFRNQDVLQLKDRRDSPSGADPGHFQVPTPESRLEGGSQATSAA